MIKSSIGFFNDFYDTENDPYFMCLRISTGSLEYGRLSGKQRSLLLQELHVGSKALSQHYIKDASLFIQELFRNGFLEYLESLSGFKRNLWVRKIRLPYDIEMNELHNLKTRIFTAGYEGLLFGLKCFDPKLKADQPDNKRLFSFLAHVAYWTKEYAKIEGDIIRGEKSGVVVLSEMTKEKRRSHIERKRRKVLHITAKLPQHIPYIDLLDYIHDKGHSEIKLDDVKRAYGEMSTTSVPLTEDLPSNLNKYSCKFKNFEMVDHILALKKTRDEIMYALAYNIGDGRKIAFTAEHARTVDLFYFGMLPLVDDIYEDSGDLPRYRNLQSQLKYLENFKNQKYSIVINAKIVELKNKLEIIRRGLLIRIPDVDTSKFKVGMAQYPFKLLDCTGETDMGGVAHITMKNNKLDIASLNLAVRRMSAILKCPVNYAYVTDNLFKQAKDDIVEMRNLITDRGYFNPKSRNVLPSVEEAHKLNDGYVPTCIKDWNGNNVFVKVLGEYKPMITWVK